MSRLLDRRHLTRTQVDADGKLALELYRAIYASSRIAYYESSDRSASPAQPGSGLWVVRCGPPDAASTTSDASEKSAGRDLVTARSVLAEP